MLGFSTGFKVGVVVGEPAVPLIGILMSMLSFGGRGSLSCNGGFEGC